MKRGAVLALAVCLAWPGSARSQDPLARLSLAERIALARLEQVHAMGLAFRPKSWREFVPSDHPAVLFERGGPALAVGFPEPPPGYSKVEGVLDAAGRQVFGAAKGSFEPPSRSPTRVAGRWAVVSEIETASAIVPGDRMGRAPAEGAIAAFVADAFAIHLMTLRDAGSPVPAGPAGYPERAQVTALTALQQRTLLRAMQFLNVTERNLDQFHALIRQVVAAWRARAQALGPDLAQAEREVESWDGLRCYVQTLVLRSGGAVNLEDPSVLEWDPTFGGYASVPLMRMRLTNELLSHFPDGPASTHGQVAARGCALAFLLDRLVFDWPPRALGGDRSLLDLAAEAVPLGPEDEPAALESAKKDFGYDVSLRLAQADLERAGAGRREALERLLPAGPRRVEILLGEGWKPAAYEDDPARIDLAGEGRLLHRGALLVEGPGLALSRKGVRADSGGIGAARAMTRARIRRDALQEIVLALPEESALKVGGKPAHRLRNPVPLSDEGPLIAAGDGLELRVTRGSLETGENGTWRIRIP